MVSLVQKTSNARPPFQLFEDFQGILFWQDLYFYDFSEREKHLLNFDSLLPFLHCSKDAELDENVFS